MQTVRVAAIQATPVILDAEATIDKAAAALDHARQLLQSSAPAVPRAVVHSDTRMTAVHKDSKFQAFIAAALTPPQRRLGKRT